MRMQTAQLFVVTFLTLGWATHASAQNATGALYVTVVDDQRAVLPGVTIELDGVGHRRTQVTDSRGQFRFLNLEPGAWSVEASLEGFSVLEYPNIDIRAGRNTTLEMQLDAAVDDRITVLAETPLLDERKVALGTIHTRKELDKIPTAGDPWSLLNQSPGVLVDRIDIGGSRADQSRFTAPGVDHSENEWQMDGVEITDQAGSGGNPITYFDMDQFAQAEISTGGTEITKAKPGASINLVSRRGTNEFRGSARFQVTDDDLFLLFKQSSPDVDPNEFPEGQTEVATNEVQTIENLGFEAGGPVIRDRLWFWGAYGQNQSKEINTGGQEQDTTVDSAAVKVNAQVSPTNSLLASWTTNDKQVPNRGGGPGRAPETLWQQRGPGDLLKIEDSHVFSSDFFLTGSYSKVDGGFTQLPVACVNAGSCASATEALLNDNGVWTGSIIATSVDLPSEHYVLEGSYFFGSAKASHELKVGGRLREFEVSRFVEWPGGRDLANVAGSNLGLPDGVGFFFLERNPAAPSKMEYTSVWVQDTISSGAWTFNAGLRYDHQEGNNEPASVEANSAFPELLTALDFPGDSAIDWNSISPRIGVTYALGEERKTLLRASYSRFAEALSSNVVSRLNPVGVSYVSFVFVDANLNDRWEADEPTQLVNFGGFDPTDPSALNNPNRNDPNLDPEQTDEIILGAEHAFLPELVVGANVTWRNRSDIPEARLFVRDVLTGEQRVARRDDYVLFNTVDVEQPNGQTFPVDYYRLGDHVAQAGGSLLTNGDREVDYLGASLTITKRLSQGWMMRGFFNYYDAEWDVPASFSAFDNPTRLGGDKDGEIFADTGGRFNLHVMHSSWSFNVNGMYQVAPDRPWGFNISANLYGREGYPTPYVASGFVPGFGRVAARAAGEVDDFRTEDVITTDLRLDKEFAAGAGVSFAVSAEVFNLFNEGYVLERNTDLARGTADFVRVTLSPRIWRLGVKLNWR